MALFQFPNNVPGKVFVSIGCKREYTMRSVFYGTKGTIICDNTSPTIQLFEDAEGKSYTTAQEIPVNIDNHNTVDEIKWFLDALIEGRPMPISSSEGANTVAVCCAAVESSKTGMPIQIKYPEV